MWGGGLQQDQPCRRFRMAVSSAIRGEPVNSRSGERLPAVPSQDLSAVECVADIPWHGGDPRPFASGFGSCSTPFSSGGCHRGDYISYSLADGLRAAHWFFPFGHMAVFCGAVGPERKGESSVRACRPGTHRGTPCAAAAALPDFSGCVPNVLWPHALSQFGDRPSGEAEGSDGNRAIAQCATGGIPQMVSFRRNAGNASFLHDGATVNPSQGKD